MRYGQIRRYDVANGIGIRVTVFVTGCTHNCYNCFNKEYQDFKFGQLWTDNETKTIIKFLQYPYVKGLSILGGEPMQNVPELTKIVKNIKLYTHKDIWIWSGYTFEQIIQNETKKELLEQCDVLVDGQFKEELKDLTLKFRGSSNQRIIDVQKSLKENRIILYEL